MAKEPQLTPQTEAVLRAIMSTRQAEMAGAEIATETRLKSGSLYPILMRLERAGWLSSRWEDGDPQALGRPRRRYYKLTATGERALRAKAASMADMVRGLAWR